MGAIRRILFQRIKSTPVGISADPFEIRRLLERACDLGVRVMVQPRGVSLEASADSETSSEPAVRVSGSALEFHPQNRELKVAFSTAESLGLEPGAGVLLLVYLKAEVLGFHAELNAAGKVSLFTIPEKMFKLQRRDEIRFEVPKAYEYAVHYLGKQSRLADLSEKSCSFLPMEGIAFKKGEVLRGVSMVLQGRRVTVDALVRRVGKTVGVSFDRIRSDDAEFLTSFIAAQLVQRAF